MTSEAEQIAKVAKLETSVEHIEKRLDSLENHLSGIKVAVIDLKIAVTKHDLFWKVAAGVISPIVTALGIELIHYLILLSQAAA